MMYGMRLNIYHMDKLTNKQIEILWWIAEGKTNQEIAKITCLKRYSIEGRVRRIFINLDVHNRTQAAVKAVRLGVIK